MQLKPRFSQVDFSLLRWGGTPLADFVSFSDPFPDKFLLSADDLARFFSACEEDLEEVIMGPTFPKPVMLRKNAPRWFKHEVLAWLILLPPCTDKLEPGEHGFA
jgi:hypothetical protein